LQGIFGKVGSWLACRKAKPEQARIAAPSVPMQAKSKHISKLSKRSPPLVIQKLRPKHKKQAQGQQDKRGEVESI